MTLDNLFDDKNIEPQIDPNKNYFEELVGDDKKFKTPELLAKGKAEADNYIKTLERQLDIQREDFEKLDQEYKSAASLRELLDQYKTQQHTSSEPPIDAKVIEQPSFDPNQLDSLIDKKIERREVEHKLKSNLDTVKSKLQEEFGPQYQTKLKQHVDELGLSIEDVNDLARKSPKAFFKTLGFDAPKDQSDLFQAPPRSSERSDSFKPNAELRDWAYYEKMRKDNPTLYKSQKTHVQMHKDATDIDVKYGPGTFMRRK